ncbi:hypothetical protein T484DRAFT_1972090 [Baffinella frigidus]|nr:hypothetical protein T484DRAFT_1972090 [Cryptophyta sp. CCMP2293]
MSDPPVSDQQPAPNYNYAAVKAAFRANAIAGSSRSLPQFNLNTRLFTSDGDQPASNPGSSGSFGPLKKIGSGKFAVPRGDGASDPFMRMLHSMANEWSNMKPPLSFRREATLNTIKQNSRPKDPSAESTAEPPLEPRDESPARSLSPARSALPGAARPPKSLSRNTTAATSIALQWGESPSSPFSPRLQDSLPKDSIQSKQRRASVCGAEGNFSPLPAPHSLRHRRASVCGADGSVGPVLALHPSRQRRASVVATEQPPPPPAAAQSLSPASPLPSGTVVGDDWRGLGLPGRVPTLPHPLVSGQRPSYRSLRAPGSSPASSPRVSLEADSHGGGGEGFRGGKAREGRGRGKAEGYSGGKEYARDLSIESRQSSRVSILLSLADQSSAASASRFSRPVSVEP